METPFDESMIDFDGIISMDFNPDEATSPTYIILLNDATGEIVLYSPEIGNLEQIKTGQIEQPNISGQANIVRQSYWPIIYKLMFRFNNIRKCPANLEIIEYLAGSVGQQMTLIDHTEQVWVGVLITPQAELTHNQRDSIVIEFEGSKA